MRENRELNQAGWLRVSPVSLAGGVPAREGEGRIQATSRNCSSSRSTEMISALRSLR